MPLALGLVWKLLTSPAGRLIGAGLAVVILIGVIRQSGVEHERKAEAQREAIAEKKAAETAKANAAMASDLRQQLAAAQAATSERTVYLTRRVKEYVTPAADSRCVVNAGFVRAYDAAALGLSAPSAGAGGSDEAPSGVALSGVLETDVANLGAAHDAIDEAGKWREWYQALTSKPVKPKKRWGLF